MQEELFFFVLKRFGMSVSSDVGVNPEYATVTPQYIIPMTYKHICKIPDFFQVSADMTRWRLR